MGGGGGGGGSLSFVPIQSLLRVALLKSVVAKLSTIYQRVNTKGLYMILNSISLRTLGDGSDWCFNANPRSARMAV